MTTLTDGSATRNTRVMTTSGIVEGAADPSTGVRSFQGIPFAAPPVGALRWCPPQPPQPWSGVRKAQAFGPRAMQQPVFGDMGFRSDGISEDCLYLNVWTPAASDNARLAVLVYFYGGGFVAGDGSEPRYDGAALARRGIVTLTVNYRLGAFGFLAHPELTQESPHASSGNYTFLDQLAALRWVRENIAAFGGDPERVTVAGESAGSFSVCAQMASPLARGLLAGAIGSSGSLLGVFAPVSLAEAEQRGLAFAHSLGARSLAALRALPADQILAAPESAIPGAFPVCIDGYVLPRSPVEIFAAGAQAPVPLLAGWNSEESGPAGLLGQDAPTPAHVARAVRALYGDRADEVLQLYPAASDAQALQSATDLASDRFMGYSTWKWCELHRATSGRPVYRYFYAHPRPPMRPEMAGAVAGLAGGIVTGPEASALRQPPPRGAVHSADIEYAMGNLHTNMVYDWTPDDDKVSALLQAYYVNFVNTGDPNGPDLPPWPATTGDSRVQVMRLDVDARAESEQQRERYLFMDQHA